MKNILQFWEDSAIRLPLVLGMLTLIVIIIGVILLV